MKGGVLVDTPVWIGHFTGRQPRFAERLIATPVRLHDFTLGELMLGSVSREAKVLSDLAKLPRIHALSHDEVVAFIRNRRLEGSGIGWVDAHLLAAADAEDAGIWTLDRALITAATKIGIPAGT